MDRGARRPKQTKSRGGGGMRRASRLFVVLVGLLLPHEGFATKPTHPVLGSLIPQSEKDLSSLRAMEVARETATCTTKRNPIASKTFILARDAAAVGAAATRLQSTMAYCLPYASPDMAFMMRFAQRDLQALLAEAVLRQHSASLPAAAPTPGAYHEYWVSPEPAREAMDETAICIARTHPEAATAVIASTPGSDAEAGAFGVLMPLLKECIAPTAAFKATKPGIRMSLAAALYHRAYDGDGATASATAGKN